MMIARVIALCVAAAMICSGIRVQRPEIATAVSLAAGIAVLALLHAELIQSSEWVVRFRELLSSEEDIAVLMLRAAGIAVLSELGGQLCVDCGERALAGRIALAARVTMLGLCAPVLVEIVELVHKTLG